MKIFFDSRDLISLFEKQDEQTISASIAFLTDKNHMLVYSMNTVMEVSAPLIEKESTTNVMQILNRMTNAPHVFIAEAVIEKLELEEAIRAYSNKSEFELNRINPFVDRYDQAISPFTPPSTADYIKYDLALTVYELWQEDPSLFEGYESAGTKLHQLMELDRKLPKNNYATADFAKTLKRNLDLYKIAFPQEELESLATWVLESNSRCPSIRLGYEVFHKIVKNITDKTDTGDIPDFSHVSCIPYVDLITLDKRMRGYVEQAAKSLNLSYADRLCVDYNNLLNVLGYEQA